MLEPFLFPVTFCLAIDFIKSTKMGTWSFILILRTQSFFFCRMDMAYMCVYCPEKLHFNLFHNYTTLAAPTPREGNKILSIARKTLEDIEFKRCREQGRTITINNEREKVHVSKPNIIPKDSPFKKVAKFAEAIETENYRLRNYVLWDIAY